MHALKALLVDAPKYGGCYHQAAFCVMQKCIVWPFSGYTKPGLNEYGVKND
ncbi:hypothetical protein HMPREF0281_02247 [Corynebacterium ammoniagenes DSM 20306]|uniref:Uncharacterized protein n=1 Tax=Corynebacterium ammoniagenes DSM 20306 TaxID=649754 RepID=A0ABN0ABY9_CORAM|nr:hypothetical protein HMPREF0281_02247 [Corynebacterium ammoniagenes DSM 20306]